jgi:pimeloyl-ACP methyl ester carboxylesterase
MLEKIKTRDKEHIGVSVFGSGKPVVLLHGFGMESRYSIQSLCQSVGKPNGKIT